MGFYSFYKIIKDIIRTLFGNKFLKFFIICFIICFFFIFYNNKVNASNTFTVTTTNNYTLIIPNDYLSYEYIYILSMSGRFFCIGTNTHLYREQSWSWRTIGNTPMLKSSPGISISNNTLDFSNVTPYIDETRPAQFYGGSTSIYCEFASSYAYSSDQSTVIKQPNFVKPPSYINPSLGNTQTQLENLSFSNFIINANDYTEEIENNDGTLYMLFYNKSLDNTTVDYLYPIKEKGFTKGSIYTDYENSTSSNIVFSFPIFMSGVFFNVGSTYQIRFAKQNYNSEYGIMTYEYLGDPYTFTISSNVTQDYINQLNQQTATSTDSETTQELQNSINQQTQSINDINNSINDSTVDNSSINLPTDNTNDPTQSGVDNIFQTIYNSFTSGTAQDIVFPIPFTNKNITLQANYLNNMLQNNGASWVINIIQAFWWYMISRFIITDIMKKIRKIKQGNFENIQNSNIKEDML